MLETFYFAIYAYDLAPDLIVNAIDCLDLGAMDPKERERDAALMAHELNGILTKRSDLPLYGVPEKTDASTVVLVDDGPMRIVLERQGDGRWRFTRDTVERIPRMRVGAFESDREHQRTRGQMAEGRTDPETTQRRFMGAALVRRDFVAAARYLDLSDVPERLRAKHGPMMARKLVFVMQRCGFAFPQEFPSDPDGWRYIWHSNHRGRIMLDRVRQADNKDAWLYSRMTLHNLDALVDGFRDVPPDPRYARLGLVVDADMLAAGEISVTPPSHVPPGQGSPRSTLRTFFEAIDELEFDDARAQDVLSCMDLGEIREADRTSMGLRLGAKLNAILRPLNLDLQSLSDSWEAEPLDLAHDGDAALKLAKQADGAWRFDGESVASIPVLFDRLAPEDKAAIERRTPFSSARQTVRTLMTGIRRGDTSLAAECLDLDRIPAGARHELGPGLAFKLHYILERLGRVVVHEIPNEPDGPRHYLYRGTMGRISLARDADPARPGDWLFTPETIRQIDPMFRALFDREISASAGGLPLALRLRGAMPSGLRAVVLGLAVYQWLGLILIAAVSLPIGKGILTLADATAGRLLAVWGSNLGNEHAIRKLRPLGLQCGVWLVYQQLPLLDLPIEVVGQALTIFKLLWGVLLAWTVLCLIDLAAAIYQHGENLKVRNNLSDMIVPTAMRALKLATVVATLCWVVALLGNSEWLTKLIAGLGLIGLAASLAAQDTLKNFFGTLLLIGEHPFKIGDSIVVGGTEGTVESVGFRSTRIRTAEDSVATIPNSMIAGATIDNRGLRKARRYRTVVPLDYNTPIDRLMTLRDALREIVTCRPDIIRADKADVYIHGLGTAAIELLVNVFFWAESSREELEARDWLNREMLRLMDSLGISVANPTQSIQLVDRPSMTPPAPKAIPHAGHPHAAHRA
ncbi:MAG: mechanosensitive ion channel family protein [Isosphaeraceae bacterium]